MGRVVWRGYERRLLSHRLYDRRYNTGAENLTLPLEIRIIRKREAAKRQWLSKREVRLASSKRCLGYGEYLNGVRAKSQDYCKDCYPKTKSVIAYCIHCDSPMEPRNTRTCAACTGDRVKWRKRHYAEYSKIRQVDQRQISTLYKNKLKGGGCVICGYVRDLSALEFHHLGGDKGKDLSRLKNISSINKELTNHPVVVLCANCHRELHSGLVFEEDLLVQRVRVGAKSS